MRYVILGGGVAGTTVAEHIPHFDPSASVTLVSASTTVKRVVDLKQHGEIIQSFGVEDASPKSTVFEFICDVVEHVDFDNKIVELKSSRKLQYDKLCIAMGARPKIIYPNNSHVVGIRDTESVEDLQERLKSCKHVTVVGNGGIASELVFAANQCNISWVIKDETISSVFVDSVASKFLLDSFLKSKSGASLCEQPNAGVSKRHIYRVTACEPNADCHGSALGPDWYNNVSLSGPNESKHLEIEYGSEVSSLEKIQDGLHNLKVTLTSGKVLFTDVMVSATGVIPNSDIFKTTLDISDVDQGIIVDKTMQTSRENVFAAGDVCTIPWRECENWKQMRLWTQALQQGFYTARSMCCPAEDPAVPDISFELFTHSTRLFGYKVILLGRYQEWKGCECYFRITPGEEFVKLVVSKGRVQGALLVGETDLEEVMENLILNQLDISHLGEQILDPNVDIEDYFD